MKPLALLLCTLAPLLAQQPRVMNGRLESRAVTSLERDVESLSGPVWVGYAVEKAPGFGDSCCYSDSGHGCGLEGHNVVSTGQRTPVRLEGDRFASILLRIEAKTVRKVRVFALDCELDAGGLPFLWLSGVKPAESVAWLESRLRAGGEELKTDSLVAALAAHADPAADRALEALVAPSQPLKLREKAAFWMGTARGRRGYEILSRLVREDKDERMREKTVFALHVSKEPQAVDAIIGVAKADPSPHVRGQALFWLGQRAGKKAVGAISDAIRDDPETEVKKKAVFALSQLPKDEGVPLLIDVARKNQNAAVRKQAFFWLGQSRDPRALAFFEQVLVR